MDFPRPTGRPEALAAQAGHPAAAPLTGGTGVRAGTGRVRRLPGHPPEPAATPAAVRRARKPPMRVPVRPGHPAGT